MAVQNERIRLLNDMPPDAAGRYVLYGMQQSQRANFNPALEIAIEEANRAGLPVAVCFGLTDDYPEANARHYAFMLAGLADVGRRLRERRTVFALRRGDPAEVAIRIAARAALVVCDRGYLAVQKAWRDWVAREAGCCVIQVEGDVVVPVDVASDKHEHAARTLRSKLSRHVDRFLLDLPDAELAHPAPEDLLGPRDRADPDPANAEATLAALKLDRSVAPVRRFAGGREAGLVRLAAFIEDRLDGYAERRGVPTAGAASHLSPYLHFGQLSPVEIARRVLAADAPEIDRQTYVEELLVRRELAMNHVPASRTTRSGRACRPGLERRWRRMPTILDPSPTGRRSSQPAKRGTRPGMRPWPRCGKRATCTTICACIGARRSWNGRPIRARRSKPRWR